ncbi:MAG: biotin/lipoyl-binding protein, partial [Phycisphaerae bacterium]|nr:biotin/lipoyl-binding protein [Phycisphaerae bacterium]
MPRDFKLPDLGEGIHEAQVIRVLIQTGQTVKEDQPLMEVETDKAAVEIPSPFGGTVTAVNVKEGQTIHVGDVIVSFDESGGATTDHVEGRDQPLDLDAPVVEGLPARVDRDRRPDPEHRGSAPALVVALHQGEAQVPDLRAALGAHGQRERVRARQLDHQLPGRRLGLRDGPRLAVPPRDAGHLSAGEAEHLEAPIGVAAAHRDHEVDRDHHAARPDHHLGPWHRLALGVDDPPHDG